MPAVLILFDLASTYGPWGSVLLFLSMTLLWGGIVWVITYWLRCFAAHTGSMIAQVKIVWFLAGVVVLIDLIFVPITLLALSGMFLAFGALAVIITQTIIYLWRMADTSGGRGRSDPAEPVPYHPRNRDYPF